MRIRLHGLPWSQAGVTLTWPSGELGPLVLGYVSAIVFVRWYIQCVINHWRAVSFSEHDPSTEGVKSCKKCTWWIIYSINNGIINRTSDSINTIHSARLLTHENKWCVVLCCVFCTMHTVQFEFDSFHDTLRTVFDIFKVFCLLTTHTENKATYCWIISCWAGLVVFLTQ